jgi:acyl carrier protein
MRLDDIIRSRVVKTIKNHIDPDGHLRESEFTDDAKILDLGDSLDMLEIILVLQEEFDVDIPDDVAEKIKTIGDAVRRITEIEGKIEMDVI